MTYSGAHNLAVAILLRAAEDTGHCGVAPQCPHGCSIPGAMCDMERFWESPWARILCDEVGIDNDMVIRWARQRERTAAQQSWHRGYKPPAI